MKIKTAQKIFTLLFIVLLSSCLPVSKQTTCGENEAYNAQERKCVPTIGTGPNTIFIQNASPANSYTTNLSGGLTFHNIVVSDTYNYGFTTRWQLSYGGSTSMVAPLGAGSYTFDPQSLTNAGTYVLEVGVFNADLSILYDSKSWTIQVDALAAPDLTNFIPAASAFTYASNLTSATHSADLVNTDAVSGSYRILVDSVVDTAPTSTGTFTGAPQTFSVNIDPSALGMGLHTVEIQLYNTFTSAIYNTYVWTINIIAPDLPQIQLGTSTPSLYSPISVISAESFATGGYLDNTNASITEICIDVDDSDKDNDGNSDIDIEFQVDATLYSFGTFNPAGPTPNRYCASAFPTITLANSEIPETKSLVVRTKEAGSSTVIETVQYQLNIRPRNIRPLIAIDGTQTSGTLGCTATSSVNYTGCVMLQSSDVDSSGDYTDNGEDEDNSRNFAIMLQTGVDPDITSETDYSVYYEIKSTNPSFEPIDGTNALTQSDCEYAVGETTGTIGNSKLSCVLNIDAFNTAGNIPPGNYEVRAYILDNGTIWDATNKESNRVTWEVAVSELQTANSISIAAQSADTATPVTANESWLENNGASCLLPGTVVTNNVANSVTEDDFLTVHTFVRDRERDNFNIEIEVTNALGGGYTIFAPSTVVNRTDGSEYVEVESCFKVPQFAVSGAANGLVEFNVSVSDLPDIQPPQAPASATTFTAYVIDYNPAPTFADNSAVDLSGLTTFAGFPFSLNAPTYSDLNTSDGETVIYKWQVSVDGEATWEDIPNANDTDQAMANLIWTPSLNINSVATDVSLRLCLGDNGFGNPADCSVAASTKVYQNLNVLSAESESGTYTTASQQASDRQNIASWYDEPNSTLYSVWTQGIEIFVNKKVTETNGEITVDHTISFDSEPSVAIDPTVIARNPENLSVSGVSGTALFIAYNMFNPGNTEKNVKIRRLDLTDGDLAFNYGGFFNAIADTNDRVDSEATATQLSFNPVGNGDLQIVVNAVNPGDNFNIFTSSGTVSLLVGNNPGELCGAPLPTCPTEAALAANIATFINDHTDPEISKELTASNTSGSTIVTINGPGVGDYINVPNKLDLVGNISISTLTSQWAIPYIDTANSLRLRVLRGSGLSSNIGAVIPTTGSVLATGNFNQVVKAQFQSDGDLILVSLNTNNNIDIYRLDSSYNMQAPSITDAYSLGGYNIENFDFDIGSSDYIYVASKSLDSGSGDDQLNTIIANADLSDSVANETYSPSNLVNDIELVKVSASQTVDGKATLAILTSAANPNPNNLFVANISHPSPGGLLGVPAVFNTSTDTNYSSPAINGEALSSGSSFYLTKSVQVTKGHLNESSTPGDGGQDVTKEAFFLNFMTDDSTNIGVKTTLINSEAESIMSNSSATNGGAFPALIKN